MSSQSQIEKLVKLVSEKQTAELKIQNAEKAINKIQTQQDQ